MATRKRAKSLDDINSQLFRISLNALQSNTSRNYRLSRLAQEIGDRYAQNILSTRSQKNYLKKEKPFEVSFSNTDGTTTSGGWQRKYTGYQDKSTTKALSNG